MIYHNENRLLFTSFIAACNSLSCKLFYYFNCLSIFNFTRGSSSFFHLPRQNQTVALWENHYRCQISALDNPWFQVLPGYS